MVGIERFTSVDCLLETKSLLLLIEGKRTEAVSDSTDWFPGRNQVIWNLEVAQALAAGRNFAVLICAELRSSCQPMRGGAVFRTSPALRSGN
jgi:hypothetical protein